MAPAYSLTSMPPQPPVESMVIAVARSDEANAMQAALIEAEYRVTRMSTAGGFLRRGNVTLLIGVRAGDVDAVIEIIRSSGGRRTGSGDQPTDTGTRAFVLPVARFARI